jgi:acetyltransferase-like isoleucine patch superfamily enzyme
VGPRAATSAVGRARTVALLGALDLRLRLHGGRLHAAVDPTARIDGPIELRMLGEGDGQWELAIELGPHAWLGRGIGIELSRGRSTIRVGAASQLCSGVRFWTRAGEINIGPRVKVREHSALQVSGRLDVGAETLIGLGCQVHCADRIELRERCALAHAVTVLDHDHAVDGSAEWWPAQPLAVEPVVIGSNTVVTAGARVLRGARVGRDSLVGANAVVRSGEYPDASLLVGAPARVVRALR